MKKMKRMKEKNLIIIIVLFVILFIILGFCIYLIKDNKEKQKQLEINQQKKEMVEKYTKVTDFKSIEEVLIFLGSEFISQQDAEEENLDYIVKAKLKYNLDLKNKNYYENIIQYSASATGYKNFCIIDEEKNIKILVMCNNSQSVSSYYINNEKFYFEKLESYENIEKTSKTEIVKINSICSILQDIIKNKWTTTNVELGTKDSIYKGYNIYFDEGYEIRKVDGKIYNIVFTDKYLNEVIENLKVNSTKEEIIKTLGEATFEASNCIGYKTEKFYVFFTNNQISIYPVVSYSTDEIINIIQNYNEHNDFKTYINQIKAEWQDYDILKGKNEGIILQYTLKGITFKYDNTAKQGIVLYNNYNGSVDNEHSIQDVKEQKASLPQNFIFEDKDLVFEEEINRMHTIDDYTESDNFANEKVLNTSKKFKAYLDINTNNFCFVSINKQFPNSELREDFDYGIWYEDNKFIFSVEKAGIYIYNAENRTYSTLKEGNEKFKLIKIEDNKLYYDENSIEL